MAQYSSKDIAFIYIGGYNVLSASTELHGKVTAITTESTVLGNTWQAFTPLGLSQAELTQGGYFDDATNSSNAAAVTAQGTSRVLSYGLEGNTVGKKFVGYQGAIEVSYERIASLGDLHRANAIYKASGTVDIGLILDVPQARVATWNTQTTPVDNGASSALGGVGYLQVEAYSGFTNVVFKVRHSADNVTYADLATFTTVTSAPGGQTVSVAGTVNRYLAMSGTVTGSGSVTAFTGFKRG